MTVIDFNLLGNISHDCSTSMWKGLADVLRTDCFCSIDGLPANARISQMRATLPRQSPCAKVLVQGPISLHGLCSINLSPIIARHRNMFAGDAMQTLSCWVPHYGCAQHAGQSQRNKRLADLRRLRAGIDRHRHEVVGSGRLRCRTKANCLRLRLDYHRSMPHPVSVGEVSQAPRRNQTSYTDRLAGKHSLFYPHFLRENARCQGVG